MEAAEDSGEHVLLDDSANLSGRDGRIGEQAGVFGDEHRKVRFCRGKPAVRTFDEAGVQGDEVHQGTEAELLLQEAAGDFEAGQGELRIEKELDGIIAGLSVDIDSAREVRGKAVIQPIIVGEPGPFGSYDEQIARACVSDAEGGLIGAVQDLRDPRLAFEQRVRAREKREVVQVNVRDLMVGKSEGFAGAAIEQIQAQLKLDGQPALLAEKAVEVNGGVHLGDAVLRKNQRLDGALAEEVEQFPDEGVDLPQIAFDGRMAGTETLEIVIEVGEVNEVECGLVFLFDPPGGCGDPA